MRIEWHAREILTPVLPGAEPRDKKMCIRDSLYTAGVVKMTSGGLSSAYLTTYSGYDQAGNVTQYRLDVYEGSPYTNTYTYTHARYEGYREAALSGTSTALDPGQTTYRYDANGNLIGVTAVSYTHLDVYKRQPPPTPV